MKINKNGFIVKRKFFTNKQVDNYERGLIFFIHIYYKKHSKKISKKAKNILNLKSKKFRIKAIRLFEEIEKWTVTLTKFEIMEILNPLNVPCGPVLSMKELAEEPSLRASGTVVEVDHPERGKYLTVGNPIKLSDSTTSVIRSPLLGEHTDEILKEILGLSEAEIVTMRSDNIV